MKMSGQVNLNTGPMTLSAYWGTMFESAGKVIPLVIPPKYEAATAWNVAVVKSGNAGLIPRIYMLATYRIPMELPELISRLRATGQLPSETFSVVSQSPTRTLFCFSFSKSTDPSPDDQVRSIPITSDDTSPDDAA